MLMYAKAVVNVALCMGLPAAAQPVIADQGVTNAASYSILQVNGGGLAPGSLIVIFGSGLGPATLQSAATHPLQTELAGTRVRIGNTLAFIVYTSGTQVAAILPSTIEPGTHSVAVTFNNQTSPSVPVPVVRTDFGIFTRNAAGYGQAAAQTVLAPNNDVRTLGLATSVRPGEPIVLYGTGLGAIAGALDDRPPGAARTTVPVEVVIGGKVLLPEYAGRSPNHPGLDQINVTAPTDVAAGCYVAVAVRANGRLSNVVSVPFAQTGRTCPHPFNISEQSASRIDAGGNITIAMALGERRSSEMGVVGEGAGIGFAEVDANSLETTVDTSTDPYHNTRPGTCALQAFPSDATLIRRPMLSRPRFLDAGSVVRLAGPSFATELRRVPGEAYGTNLPNGTLRAGLWTFSSAGGSDIAPFQLATELPNALTWTNRQDTIDPRQALRIDWLADNSTPVKIVVTAGTQASQGMFSSITCTVAAQDRSVTIPAALMATLPSGGSGGVILTQEVTRSGFNVPLARGGTVDGSLLRITDQTSGAIRVQ
jgi:uncharacterized protein (TIGR03437 family)